MTLGYFGAGGSGGVGVSFLSSDSQQTLDWPQICVVGGQAEGKSTLLSAIVSAKMDSKMNFLPEGTGMVTRCPIEVQMTCTDVAQHTATVVTRGCPSDTIRGPGQEPSAPEPATPPDQQSLAFGSLGLQHLGTIGDGACASRILSRTAAQGQQIQQPSNTDPSSGMGTWAKMMVDRTPAAESTQNATAEGTQSPQPKWKQLVEERIHRVRAQTAACDTDARRSSGPDGSSTPRSALHDDGLENLHHPAGTSASSQPSLTATTRMEPPSPPASPPDFVASPPPRVGAPSASAAVTLQSAWRRSVSSRELGAKKASARESQLAEWVATRMQAVVRRRNAKDSVVKLKSTVKLQSAYRKRAQQKELNTAVVVMQNAWRAKSVRKHKTEIRRNALIEKLERKSAREFRAAGGLLRRRQSAQDLMTKESATMKDLFDFKAAELFECVVTGCRILR